MESTRLVVSSRLQYNNKITNVCRIIESKYTNSEETQFQLTCLCYIRTYIPMVQTQTSNTNHLTWFVISSSWGLRVVMHWVPIANTLRNLQDTKKTHNSQDIKLKRTRTRTKLLLYTTVYTLTFAGLNFRGLPIFTFFAFLFLQFVT